MKQTAARSSSINRRTFLKLAALAASSVACRAAGIASTIVPTTSQPTGAAPTATSAVPTFPPVTPGQVAVPSPTATQTVALPTPAFIIDGHEDLAWNWIEFGRDPTESAIETRSRETYTPFGQRTTGLPEWIEGRVGIIFSTIYVAPSRASFTAGLKYSYSTNAEAYTQARDQLKLYQDLVANDPRITLITNQDELDQVVGTWTSPERLQTPRSEPPPVGFVLLMEGADPIEEPEQVREWYAEGLRIVGPAWHATQYSGGTDEPGPLTDLGRELLQVMGELNMVLDLSHIAEEAYLEAVETYTGPIIASHSNPRAFFPTDRSLSDDMILKLADRGGVMGVVLYNAFLSADWRQTGRREDVTLNAVAEVIDYVVQVTGSIDNVAIGSDLDGGFGVQEIPTGMDSAADLLKIADTLVNWGYTDEDIEQVMNGNWLRILRQCLPEST